MTIAEVAAILHTAQLAVTFNRLVSFDVKIRIDQADNSPHLDFWVEGRIRVKTGPRADTKITYPSALEFGSSPGITKEVDGQHGSLDVMTW